MAEKSNMQPGPSAEQLIYAKILEKGMYVGLLLLFATFIVYTFGILRPYIPLGDVSKYWSLGVDDYLHEAGVHAGWSWLGMLNFGDYLNFIPIAILAGVTVVCFLSIVPNLWRNNDKVYAAFAVLEALILAVAASGILGSGGH